MKGFFGFDAEFIDCVFTGRAESMVFHGSPADSLEDVQALVDEVADLLDPVEPCRVDTFRSLSALLTIRQWAL